MFASIILARPFLTVALLPIAMKSLFSSDELNDMGIFLEEPAIAQPENFVDPSDYMRCNATFSCGHA
jgi:hypothetical protein